ncbi:hypothetical protein P7K49_026181 [Saguinus oedipus]|uniref:Uncharacterized protein n=1 Tax=Saguinus oedipus TaxID=9490 RepID=A0ABQ9UDA6_SAGOE|nr:hypothetical protein P7K49_026181 [Saguinus oedipus]
MVSPVEAVTQHKCRQGQWKRLQATAFMDRSWLVASGSTGVPGAERLPLTAAIPSLQTGVLQKRSEERHSVMGYVEKKRQNSIGDLGMIKVT